MNEQPSIVAEVIDFALQVPDTTDPRMKKNRVYRFFREMRQVVLLVVDERAKRKTVFTHGRAEASETPVGAHGAKDGK